MESGRTAGRDGWMVRAWALVALGWVAAFVGCVDPGGSPPDAATVSDAGFSSSCAKCRASGRGPCISYQDDPDNCGLCGRACGPEQLCSGGHCLWPRCSSGTFNCGRTCRDYQTDSNNCGRCGHPCAAGEVCSAGRCVSNGLPPCGSGVAECVGRCVNTDWSPEHCGECGHRCAFDHAEAPVCRSGNCVLGTCEVGFENCDGVEANGCEVNISGDDVERCGGCARRCTLPHALPTCFRGDCRVGSCEAGYADCDRVAANGCEINLLADPNHCGGCVGSPFTCGSERVCSQGTCSDICASGLASCDGGCWNVDRDPDHCGACDVSCTAPPRSTARCVGGSCSFECDPGTARVGDACVASP